jgi:hypothetical protein
MTDGTKHVLAIKAGGLGEDIDPARIGLHLAQNVHGTAVEFTDQNLVAKLDVARVRKTYKLPTSKSDVGTMELEAEVIGIMALKGC